MQHNTLRQLVSFYRKDYPSFRPLVITDANHMSGNKKKRLIHIPNDAMKTLHKILVRKLRQDMRGKLQSAYGGMPGYSILKTIERHKDNNGTFHRYFYALDLKSAFNQISVTTLAQILYSIDPVYFESVDQTAAFLQEFCSSKNAQGLVMGGGASPDLFNIYCEFVIDTHLRKFCEKHAITYTRYIDDLLFSTNQPIGKSHRGAIREIISSGGLIIHEQKTHKYDLHKNPVVLNGITIHANGKISIPRSFLARVRGILHKARYSSSVDIRRVAGMVNIISYLSKGRVRTATEQKILSDFHKYAKPLL